MESCYGNCSVTGGQPYKGLENQEIGKFVKEGNRLERPDGTPGEVYV